MKRQRLVSSFTPALQEWLEEELENRGVDSVYARSILSLLQQDYVDVEPQECQQPRNHQHRVLYKYGGPENLSYATKSKHQKWKTWGKHILTSASTCRKSAYYDLERLLKKAAVDCLKSASDSFAYDIEELIDEVWIKLKSKSLKGEQEEIALRNRNPLGHSFFIPPSPTDEIEKYFAAFPPLSSKNECAAQTSQHKILKNAWCKKCNMKRKSNVRDEEALNAENRNFHSNKSIQPIIPYRSLKTIKNIFKNSGFKSPWKASCAQHGTVSKRSVTYGAKSFKLTAMIKDPLLSFSNLTSANIHGMPLNKTKLLTLLKNAKVQNVLLFCNEPSISQETLVVKSSVTRKSNELSLCVLQEESSDLTPFHKEINPEDNSKKHATGRITSFQAFSEENSPNDAKGLSDYHGIDIHFRMSPLADLLEYESPCLEPSDDCSAVLQNDYCLETLKYCLSKMASSCSLDNVELCTEPDTGINCLEPENPIVQKENAFTHHKLNSYFVGESEMHSLNSSRALDIQSNLYSQNASFSKQSFNPLDTLDTSHVETSLFFSDTESDKHIESISSSNFESCCSDDEIYYSDDDSNEIFLSENREEFNFSEIPLQQTEQNCLLNQVSEDTLVKTEIQGASVSEPNQYNLIFSVDSEERSVLDSNEFKLEDETEQKLLKTLNLGSDYVNFVNVRSPYKELPFISYSQSESVDKNCVTEQKENSEYFPNILDERKSGLLIEPYSLDEPNGSDKVVASSMSKCTEGAGQKSSEIYDKKWLFYWGDNHNFIARTWQKDFVPVEEKESNEQLFYDAKVSTALCKEIKEEEEELLKGLCSVPAICNTVFGNELCKPKENDLHSSYLPSQIESLANHCEEKTSFYVQVSESRKIAVNQVENYIPVMNNSFTFDSIENNVPDMQCAGDYSVSFENNPFKAANFPDLSAFSNASEGNGSFKDYYMEGGGWSLASDSFTDYYCDNPYERSCSLSELDLEKSNNDYLEFFYQKRQRCTSETDDVEMTGCNEAPNPYKKMKQKPAPRKRPCCFFLQGTCTRSDCKYSHDLSTITCRFWSDGSCFKGSTCPFLHGYSNENDERHFQDNASLRSPSPDLSYSLESEADFPSLSSTKSEEPRVKSEAINVTYVKGSKKKRREK
ncbi:hypothetical protein AVEN_12776-1 [Araneus ventricosus]|uniref:C3H1-type domain-containing protein n=1 Tax=Araneus ventricosus TaxID=182803 RepID=A0A4Y2ADU1_ARAVE|nr:hypothetical protein AVEN_12776-1 [Araneus ventricosus]